MTHEQGDVVVTLFPFADGPLAKERPALIFGGPWKATKDFEVCWIAMITTTVLKGWPGDIDIANLSATGLPIPSIVRTLKIACIDTRAISKKAGVLDAKTYQLTLAEIRNHFL